MPVVDYQRALEFYRALFGIEGKAVSPGRTYFDLGGTNFCVYHPESDGDSPVQPLTTAVYLTVETLSDAHANASAANAQYLTSIETRPWGERSFYCRDPSGNILCFVDNRSQFRGQFYVE